MDKIKKSAAFVKLTCRYINAGAYLQDKADKMYCIQEEMIMSFAKISEDKSRQTGQHVKRVAEYSKILTLAMG